MEKVFRPSAGSTLIRVFVCLVVCVLLIYVEPSKTWLSIGVALVGVGFLARLLPRAAYLKLTPAGMEYKNYLPKRFIPWSDISHFSTYKMKGSTLVGWTYASNFNRHRLSRGAGRLALGVEDGMSESFGSAASSLVSILEEWRTTYSRRSEQERGSLNSVETRRRDRVE